MKKRLLIALLAVLLIVALTFTVIACGPKKPSGGGGNGGGGNDDDKKPTPEPEYTVPLKDALTPLPDAVDNLIKAGASGLRDGKVAFDATAYVIYGDINIELRLAASLDKDNSENNKALIQVKSVDAEGEVSYPVAVYLTDNTVYLYDTITNQVKDAEWFKFKIVDENGGDLIAELVSVMADFVGRNLSIKLDKKPAFDLAEDGFFGGSTYGGLFGTAGGMLDSLEVGYAKELESGGYTITLNTEALTSQLGELLDGIGGFIGGDSEGGIVEMIENMLGDYMGIVDPVVEIILGQSLSAMLSGKLNDTAVYPEIDLTVGLGGSNEDTLTQLGVHYKKAANAENDAVDIQFGLKDIVVDDSGTVTPDVESYSSAKTIAATGSLAVQLPAYANSALTKELVLTGYVDFSDIKFSFDTKTYEGVDGAPDVLGMVFEGFNADGLEAFVTATYGGNPIDLGVSYKGTGEFVLDLRGLKAFGFEDAAAKIHTQKFPSIKDMVDEALNPAPAPAPAVANAAGDSNFADYVIGKIKDILALQPGEKVDIVGMITGAADYLDDVTGFLKAAAEDLLGIDLDAEEIVIPGVNEDAGTASFTLVLGDVLDFIRNNSIIKDSEETITIAGKDYTLSSLLAEGKLVENLIAIYNYGKAAEAQIDVADLVAMINRFTTLNIKATTADELEAELEKVGFTLDAHRNSADGIGAGITAKLGNTVIASVAISFDIIAVDGIPANPYADTEVAKDAVINWTVIGENIANLLPQAAA